MAPEHRIGKAKKAALTKPVVEDYTDEENDFNGFSEDDEIDSDDFDDDDDFDDFDDEFDDEDDDSQSAEDVMAALKAAKEKKKKQQTPQTADDVMAALKAAKEKQKAASAKQPQTADDVMAALKAAKEKKNSSKKPETAEEVMAALKAAKEKKKAGNKQPQTPEETMAALKAAKDKKKSKEPQTADEVMEALKAAKANQKQNKGKTADKTMAVSEKKKTKSEPKKPEPKKTGRSLADLLKERGSAGDKPAKEKKKSDAVLSEQDKEMMKKDEDDIAYYAKMLGMKSKDSKLPQGDEDGDDDLDGLLDGLDLDFGDGYDHLNSEGEGNFSDDDNVPNLVGGSEDENEFDEEMDTAEGLPFSSDDEINSDDFDSDVDLASDEEMEDDDENTSDGDEVDDESQNEEMTGFSSDDTIDSDDFDSDEETPKQKENPYVAPVPAGKYVPPSVRKRLEAANGRSESEEVAKLHRIIKGHFNKLTEANIGTIVGELSRLYLNYPRQHVTAAITDIVIDSTSLQGTLLDSFLMVHATLITALYKTGGVEFGAHFLQTLVETFEKHYQAAMTDSKNETKTVGKVANNLLALLAELYSFQFISCKLIYDLIRMLLEGEVHEAQTELLLKLIRSSGSQLRSDDPAALKDIIYQLQLSVSKTDANSINARTKFLVETISELKNNRQKHRAGGVSETTSALKTRMKKFLGTVQGKMSEPLRVSLDDIRNVETKGKWWLVGSAWRNVNKVGSNDAPGATATSNNDEDNVDLEAMEDILENAEPDWMELARQQRMNTDIRRAIFVALMSSEDYVDACDRLQRLKLKSKQEREIPRVLLHCLCSEEVYNPFYAVVATRLCSNQRSIRKTFQFALWDFLSDLETSKGGARGDDDEAENSDEDPEERMERLKRRGERAETEELTDDQKLRKAVHMARLYAYFTAQGVTSLDILKTANFLAPSSETQIFLELYFITLFTQLAKKNGNGAGSAGSAQSQKSRKMSFGEAMFQPQGTSRIDERGLVEVLTKTSKTDNAAALLKKIKFFLQKKLLKSSAIGTKKSQREKVEWGVNATVDLIEELQLKYGL
ncbi:hypothetical protein D0Z00_002347 [Geotrichum galactomycetum]|uniref:Uncharacterized protein n=1 Tax=Geotrichum galactomycetum TaxID=27317 RepID=A0ACB6V4D8_9ASCO|nr:hypothetical protein D0Z00_002347 [Geotrichum candidum]